MRRVLLDANLLVLLVIGVWNRDFIPQHKRLRAYDPDAYDLLVEVVRDPTLLLFIPNVLTEVSSLAKISIPERLIPQVRRTLANLIRAAEEAYVPSGRAISAPEYDRIGLTDAALLALKHERATLWTDDHDLYMAASRRGLDAHNFTHLRVEKGNL